MQQVAKPATKAEPAAKDDSIDAMMRQAQQMKRDATADAMSGTEGGAGDNEPAETPRPLAGNDAPCRCRKTPNIDSDNGKLEFTSPSGVKSVADFIINHEAAGMAVAIFGHPMPTWWC